MSYRPWLEDQALRQMGGLPAGALDLLARAMARIIMNCPKTANSVTGRYWPPDLGSSLSAVMDGSPLSA